MNKILVAYVLTLASMWAIADAENSEETNDAAPFPSFVKGYSINPDVRNSANDLLSTEKRVEYLASVVVSNGCDTNQLQQFNKSSALRLLGTINCTNSFTVLVSNITFVDNKYKQRPCFQALVAFGEPVIPYLMNVVKDPSCSSEQLELTVQALRAIKRASFYPEQWKAFVEQQKKELPPELWGRIDRQIWIDD